MLHMRIYQWSSRPAFENDMSTDNQVFSIELGERNNVVTKFVGDNIDLNSFSLFMETLPSIQWVGSKSPIQRLLCQFPRQQKLSTEWRWRHLTKPRSREGPKILPFANRKQRRINTIVFIPWLSSSLAHDQPLLTPGDTLWTAGWMIKAQDPESHTPTAMAGWRESMQMMPSKAYRSTSRPRASHSRCVPEGGGGWTKYMNVPLRTCKIHISPSCIRKWSL